MAISVILPTHNRARILEQTLQDMTLLDVEGLKWELLVVDNASTDNTSSVVESFDGKLPIVYIYVPIPGKNRANNIAIDRAQGDLLVFTDDDITPRPNWLIEIDAASKHWPRCRVFGGRVLPSFPNGTKQYLQDSWYSAFVYAIHDRGERESLYDPGESPVGPNCWFRRSIFSDGFRYDEGIGPEGANGRRPLSGSELEFFERLISHGEVIAHIPTAVVHHRIQDYQTKLGYLLRRSHASGRGHVRISSVDPNAKRWFKVPRYLYRQIAASIVRAGLSAVALQRKRSIEELVRSAMLVGMAKQCRLGS